ncbi:hypothetical protein [Kitasatospora sp. NPDC017646]
MTQPGNPVRGGSPDSAVDADGVLRVQDMPTAWEVGHHDSGAGHRSARSP